MELYALWLSPLNVFSSHIIFLLAQADMECSGAGALDVEIGQVPWLLVTDGSGSVNFWRGT